MYVCGYIGCTNTKETAFYCHDVVSVDFNLDDENDWPCLLCKHPRYHHNYIQGSDNMDVFAACADSINGHDCNCEGYQEIGKLRLMKERNARVDLILVDKVWDKLAPRSELQSRLHAFKTEPSHDSLVSLLEGLVDFVENHKHTLPQHEHVDNMRF